MTEEEIQALKTELDTTKTELESIRGELGTAQGERDTFKDSIAVFEQAVASKDAEIVTLKQSVSDKEAEKEALGVYIKAETQRTIDDFTDSYNLAVAAYKKAVGQANSAIPAELIIGDTIEAIDQSLESAKILVAQVRQSVEADIAAGKVPAGAPARTPPDLSALSPREKIQYAVTKEGGK